MIAAASGSNVQAPGFGEGGHGEHRHHHVLRDMVLEDVVVALFVLAGGARQGKRPQRAGRYSASVSSMAAIHASNARRRPFVGQRQ